MSAHRPVRVRKARRSSLLACGHYVTTGQQITSRDHGPWVCIGCAAPRRLPSCAQRRPDPGRPTVRTELEVVQLLRLPGRHRALVDAETAELGERMGELRRLDTIPDPDLAARVFPGRGGPPPDDTWQRPARPA